MKTALSPTRVHRLRRIVGWLAVLLLGFALSTVALAACSTHGPQEQGGMVIGGRPTATGA